MTLIRESYLYYLWQRLHSAWEDCALRRLLDRLCAWCAVQVEESAILRPLCREGAVARAWPESLLCRITDAVLNLPGTLLHRLYAWKAELWEGSFFARLAFDAGGEGAAAQFWLLSLLWIIPYERWNNAYTLMGALCLLALFYVGAMRTGRRLDLTHIGFFPLVFFGAVCLAVFFSWAPSLSLRFWYYHLSAALLALLTVSTVRHAEDLKRLCAAAAVCVAVSGGYGIVQRIQGVKVNPAYVDALVNEGMPGRVYSFYDNPNTFAELLVMLLPLVLALILTSRRALSRAAACAVFAVGAAALAMTYSRACYVGAAVAMAVLVFLWKPRLLPAFFLLCLAAVPLLPSTVLNRLLTITNMEDTTTSSRFPLYQAALEVIRQSPIRGAGLGTAAVQNYIKSWNLYHARAPFVHAHNFYLEVWLETGLLGVVSFTAAVLWNIKNAARKARRTAPSEARTIAAAAAAALCGILVSGIADYPWNYPRVMSIFWFVFAVAIAAARLCVREADA